MNILHFLTGHETVEGLVCLYYKKTIKIRQILSQVAMIPLFLKELPVKKSANPWVKGCQRYATIQSAGRMVKDNTLHRELRKQG